MELELYLLWDSQAWGVYSKVSCPDPGAFPDHFYREYNFPEDSWEKVFKKLLGVRARLVKDNIRPSKENYGEIFPEIEELLK